MFVVNINSTGELASISTVTNGDVLQGKTVEGMISPKSVAVSPDGRNVYVASPGSDAITVFYFDILKEQQVDVDA